MTNVNPLWEHIKENCNFETDAEFTSIQQPEI